MKLFGVKIEGLIGRLRETVLALLDEDFNARVEVVLVPIKNKFRGF